MSATIESKWKLIKLGNICECLDNQRIPISKNKRENGIFPYYGSTGIIDYIDKYIFDEELVLLGEDGANWNENIEKAFLINGKSWVNNHSHVLRFNNDLILNKYVILILNKISLRKYITGISVPKLNQNNMKQIYIPLPPIEIQQKIISETTCIYEKQNKLKTQILNINNAINNSINKNIVKDNLIWYKLNDVCDVRDGTHESPQFYSNGYPLVTSKNLVEGKIDFKNIKYISEKDFIEINKRSLVEKGDILFAMIGTIGNPVIVDDIKKFAIKNVALFKFKNSNNVINRYVKYILQSELLQNKIRRQQKNTVQKFVSLEILRNLKIPIPTLEEQKRIVDNIMNLENDISNLKKEIDALEIEKQNILNQYLY